MRFQRIRLENFKCYDKADLTLDRGVTVIHGLNGSGKSSLLAACFFALYGARALDETLEDVVTIGADDCTIELWFTHGGTEYHLTRRIRNTGDQAKTAKCVLETPEETFEGARAVRRRITELVRMDSGAFVNCAYVRQGEVNKLINAPPSDRQDMLDDLLQLGRLETYRERASDARVGVGRVRDDKQGALSQLDDQVAAKEEKDLHERLNGLETTLSETTADIEKFSKQREKAQQTLEAATSVLEEYEEKQAELDGLADDIEDLEATITETEREREQLQEQLAKRRETRESLESELEAAVADSVLEEADRDALATRREALEDRDETLRSRIEEQRVEAQKHSGEAESLTETAADLDSRAESNRTEAETLETAVEEARETIAERRERLETIDATLTDLGERFADAPVDREGAADHRAEVAEDLQAARQRVTELETTLESERESLAEAEALLEAGKCPECGQPVDESPHVDSIEADRERIATLQETLADARETVTEREAALEAADALVETADEMADLESTRETVEQLVAEKETSVESDAERVETLREEAAELETRAEAKRETAEEAEAAAAECRAVVAECNQERQAVTTDLDCLERIESMLEEIDQFDADLERLGEQRAQKAELNDQRRTQLAEKRQRRADLAEEFDESRIEDARSRKQNAEQYLEKVEPKLEDLRDRRDELQNAIGGVRTELEELETLRERREDLADALAKLEALYDETADLQELYGNLRADLRRRNVETLERMLNETFRLVYQNDSYSHIELDDQYELTVYQKDGQALDPGQLSGGERALFNLSLRCAIYRLLAEGIDGAAPMPPLILDEPTVFLDAGHVTQLLDLVAYMRDEVGVEQILVVSHDDELVGAADDLVRVEKDSTTNRSEVVRVEATVAELA